MSQQDFEDRSPHLMKSCNEKIQNDSINAPSIQQLVVEDVKSQQDLDEVDQAQLLQQFRKEGLQAEKPKLAAKPKKHPKKTVNTVQPTAKEEKALPDFGTDILESESISIDEDVIKKFQEDDKGRLLPKKKPPLAQGVAHKHRHHQKNKVKLNIVLVGRSGIGKTSFVDSFCNKKYELSNLCRQKTEQTKTYEYGQANGNHGIAISFIDVPGFLEVSIEHYIKDLEKLIFQGFDQSNPAKDKKTKNNQDRRIHCCIFFISGPWISQCEWYIMKRLQSIVNIIPVIAKGDTFTTAELKFFKKKIIEKNKIEQINLFSLEEYIRQKNPDKLPRLLSGSFGNSPPFVITCCTEKYYNETTKTYQLVRGYRWGKCELQNDDHNDFKFLKELLIDCLSDALINTTNLKEKTYKEIQKRSKQINERINTEQSFQYNSIRVNRSQRSSRSGDSSIIEERNGINFTTLFQIGLTVLGVVGVYFWFRKSHKSQG